MADAIPSPPSEEWRPIAGYEGYYEVSNLGNVRSLDRTIEDRNGRIRKLRGQRKKRSISLGYLVVRLTRDGHGENFLVHRLVALAFLGEEPPGHEVCHIDGSRDNPRADNLYWGTRADNLADSLAHGSWNNQNLGKTHCIRGHEFTAENTRLYYRDRPGRTSFGPERYCRACAREWAQRRRAKRQLVA